MKFKLVTHFRDQQLLHYLYILCVISTLQQTGNKVVEAKDLKCTIIHN